MFAFQSGTSRFGKFFRLDWLMSVLFRFVLMCHMTKVILMIINRQCRRRATSIETHQRDDAQQQMTAIKQFPLENIMKFDHPFYYMLQVLVNSLQYSMSQQYPHTRSQRNHHRRIINGVGCGKSCGSLRANDAICCVHFKI